MEQTKIQLDQEDIKKLLAKLAIPAVIAQIVNLLYNIVDRIYIGHIEGIGATALTGVGLFTPILLLITAFAYMVGSGGAPRVAIFLGKGDKKTAEKIIGNCFTMLLILAFLITIFFYRYASTLLVWFGASAETLPYATDYAKIYILGSVTVLLVLGMNPFITCQGFAKISMLTTMIGAVINIILDPILIFGFGLGVRGAAIATVLSQAVGAVWVLRFLIGEKSTVRLKKENLVLIPSIFGPCLGLGVSTFVMLSTESILAICFNTSLAKYGGDLAIGAMTIMTSMGQLITMPLSGICQGGQPIMSFNFGANQKERVKTTFRYLLTLCAGYAIILWASAMLFPRFFASVFTANEELISYTTWAMRIYMGCMFASGFQICCQQSFMALGQAKISLLMACLRKLILLIPLIYILPCFFENKVFAVFLAEPISDFIAASTTTTMFFTKINGILKKGA